MHIGIHTSWEILQAKPEVRDEPERTSETWQLSRLPQKLSKEGPNYLFVASERQVGHVLAGNDSPSTAAISPHVKSRPRPSRLRLSTLLAFPPCSCGT